MSTRIKNYRTFAMGAMTLALFVVSASALVAQQPVETTHDGKVVSVTGNTLVMASEDGKEHSHMLTEDAKVTLDGEACKTADLEAGIRIRVTTQGSDKSLANRIEGLDKNLEFLSNRLDGEVVSITGNKLVMTDTRDKEKQTCTMSADVEVSCDREDCKASDLKPGMKIRVTSQSNDPHTAIRIEAIDEDLEFATNINHDGKVVTITGTQLVMTDIQSKEERSCALASNVKVTLDGKICKFSDLKPGMKIRVNLESDWPQAAARVEAIDKNREFATL